jgi:sugar phosphate isomerase/epimerase
MAIKIGIESPAYVGSNSDAAMFAKGVQRMRAHGYECIDYGDFCNTERPLFQVSEAEFEKILTEQKKILDGEGILVSQTHGPWRFPMRDETEADRAERFEKMAKSIRGTAMLGCRNMVIHNMMPQGHTDTDPCYVKDINREYFGRLCDVAKEYDVVINLENMPFLKQCLAKPEDTLAFVKEMNTPYMRMCLDTGHCLVWGLPLGDTVRAIGKEYLSTLHVHDNDGARDLHWLPGTGVGKWEDFTAALLEIGFEGTLSLETFVKNAPEEEREVKERELFALACRLAGRA